MFSRLYSGEFTSASFIFWDKEKKKKYAYEAHFSVTSAFIDKSSSIKK